MQVRIGPEYGWRIRSLDDATFYVCGYLVHGDMERVAKDALAIGAVPERLGAYLRELDGHFGLIIKARDWTLAAVDRVRSIPLFWSRSDGIVAVGAHSDVLQDICSLVDARGALQMAMAGYTIGRRNLFQGVSCLLPGEFALFKAAGTEVHSYGRYLPRDAGSSRSDAAWLQDLSQTTLGILEKLIVSTAGRPIAVPLSAGLDSRLIVAGLRHLGKRDVICFSYGLPGNHEAETARRIAEHLQYRWTFVPLSRSIQRQFFESENFGGWWSYAGSSTSVPFVQDPIAISVLKGNGYIPPDAVVVNGQSGDFIAGNHIPEVFWGAPLLAGPDQRRTRILSALAAKHFSLWRFLATPENLRCIHDDLWTFIEELGGLGDDQRSDYGLYESIEFTDRQSKYVIAGQRTYEYFGLDWRLPLWDRDYLEFFETLPLRLKFGQRLYREMLQKNNWGGVWRDIPVNRKVVRPLWLAGVRFAAKLCLAAAGRERWHAFDRRFFSPLMDTNGGYGSRPYAALVSDKRGYRNPVSLFAEQYLRDKGVDFDRLAKGADAGVHAGRETRRE